MEASINSWRIKMSSPASSTFDPPDPAAIFAGALSLWTAAHELTTESDRPNLSETYNGMDEFMRVVVRVATTFEAWACAHIDFDELDEVWPYMLEDKFGAACLEVMYPDKLNAIDDEACLEIAMRLRLPVRLTKGLPVPVDVRITNTVAGSGFAEYRIQTVRTSSDLESVEPYQMDDDPYDDNFSTPYFGVYGVDQHGMVEHIADRESYSDAVSLVTKLAPGAVFPTYPKLETSSRS